MNSVTVEDLSSQRTGLLTDIAQGRYASARKGLCVAASTTACRIDFAKDVLAKEHPADPRSAFTYSNANYILLGAVLEKAIGTSWEELMRDRLFGPLGMTSCGFGPPGTANAAVPDKPRGHEIVELNPRVLDPGNPVADNPKAAGPAGTIHCSLSDWLKFARA